MFKVGDKVRRTKDHLASNMWAHGRNVMTVSDENGILAAFEEDAAKGPFWDMNFFELVEEAAKPTVPGIPAGYRLVRIGTIEAGESYVDNDGVVRTVSQSGYSFKNYVIVEPLAPKKVKLKQYMHKFNKTGWVTTTRREINPGPGWFEVPGSEIEVEVPDEV